MIEFSNEKCLVTIDDKGLLRLYLQGEHPFRKTFFNPDGSIEIHTEPTSESERALVAALSRHPVFAVTFGGRTASGKPTWFLDCEAGVQRFNGKCTNRELTRALDKFRVPTFDKRRLLKECRKHQWDYCPRQAQ